MKKVVFWGAGQRMRYFFEFVHKHNEFEYDQFLYVVDSDCRKWKTTDAIDIYDPSVLLKQDYDLIVITPSNSEIYMLIIKEIKKMNIDVDVMNLHQYFLKLLLTNRFYEINKKDNQFSLNNQELIVYTAISKGYDSLSDPVKVLPNTRYVCFTDDDGIQSKVWEIKKVDFGKDAQRGIRKYKILPHRFFKDNVVSVWVDGNIILSGDINEYISRYFCNELMLLFPHPERICLYEEARACIELRKDDVNIIKNQIETYKSEGIPNNMGLYCGGIIVRNHMNEKIIQCMELWWKQVEEYSIRDQISLPYVLYKIGLKIDLCVEDIYLNQWFSVSEHKK